jgi:hypothetical protein
MLAHNFNAGMEQPSVKERLQIEEKYEMHQWEHSTG